MSVVSNAVASSSSQPPRSLNRQTVLEEDEYTEALSHIIARDFFPSIAHLDATNDYLDALRSDDPLLINASVRRLEDLNTPITRTSARTWGTPSQTPYRMGPLETPLRTPQEVEPPAKRPRYDIDMSLDTFQARYTSEDNSSFTEILQDENRKRKEKYAWAWEAQKRVEAQRDRMLEARERLLIEPPPGVGVREKFVIEAPEVRGMITASGESERATAVEGKDDNVEGGDEDKEKQLAVVPTEGESEGEVDVMAPKKDTRPAGVDGWKFKARNALMFPPDADISPYHPLTSKTTEDLKVAAKVIKYDSTRLPEQDNRPTDSISAPPSPTRSRIDAAIAGTPYRPRSPNGGNFTLVPSVPTPSPAEMGPAAVKQLMTWGTITGTPRVLSQTDDLVESSLAPQNTPFHIVAPSARERISQQLSAKASKSLRAKAELLGVPGITRTPSSAKGSARKGTMPPPSWTPRRAEAPGGLTPAARRLLDRSAMGTAALRRAEVMGRSSAWEGTSVAKEKDLNRVRWTPTPSPVTRRGG